MWTLAGASANYLANPEVRAAARNAGADKAIARWFLALSETVLDPIREDAGLLEESRRVFAAAMHAIDDTG